MKYDRDLYYARWIGFTFFLALTAIAVFAAAQGNWLDATCCTLWAGVCVLSVRNMRMHQHTRDAVRAMNREIAKFAEERNPQP